MQDVTEANDKRAGIEEAIVSGILSGRIKPGARLGENQLATVFAVSRTRVREALMRLEVRCIVQVSPTPLGGWRHSGGPWQYPLKILPRVGL